MNDLLICKKTLFENYTLYPMLFCMGRCNFQETLKFKRFGNFFLKQERVFFIEAMGMRYFV
jgi:hypothetical protein